MPHSASHRRRSPGAHVRYAVGATTLAVAALVTAGSITTYEPAHAEQVAAPDPVAGKGGAEDHPHPDAGAPKPLNAPQVDPARAEIPAPEPVTAPATRFYPNNLDGWIRQALDIMADKGIPGSYEGIHRNIMRESTGDPQAINLYDSNAAKGIPSKGLLQVIDPTFAAYHVPGTPFDVWDPVANIVAACNYAAHNYGSMDNVNSAY